jgi:hypothetical protein
LPTMHRSLVISSTWEDRDLRVLLAAVSICNESRGSASANAIQQRTGLDEREVQASLSALASEQPPFSENLDTRSGYAIAGVLGPTGHARRTVQQWPNPEDKLRELIRVLELAADLAPRSLSAVPTPQIGVPVVRAEKTTDMADQGNACLVGSQLPTSGTIRDR